MLWMCQRVFFGKITHDENRSLLDLTKREIGLLLPVLLFIVWIGVYPGTFLGLSSANTKAIVTAVTRQAASPSTASPAKPSETP